MKLFPNRTQCARNIQAFEDKYPSALSSLADIRQLLTAQPTPQTIISVQHKVLTLLGGWGAYRNQRSRRNNHFMQLLAGNRPAFTSFATLVETTQHTTNLSSILQLRGPMAVIFEFLRAHMLQRNVPARIVTISKALLVICGFTPGFDSVVLNHIKKANPYILACPGVWPSYHFYNMLEYLAAEQQVWEDINGPMRALLSDVPIGQIMDRILWQSS